MLRYAGMALGMVMQLPEEADETSISKRQLLAKLDVCMGGRVAEELIFGEGDVTTGASSDIEQVCYPLSSLVSVLSSRPLSRRDNSLSRVKGHVRCVKLQRACPGDLPGAARAESSCCVGAWSAALS